VAITLAEPREHRLLRNIEQLTKQKIDVATVPTPMDVRARRLDMTRGALREALEEGELDSYRVVTDALASEFDPMDVAAAAVKLAHRALQADAAHDEEHIPSIDLSRKEPWSKGPRREARDGPPAERGAKARGAEHGAKAGGAGHGDQRMHASAGRGRRPGAATMVRVYISAGRNVGLRPADLVGAIANEAGVSAREIGAIEIEERFSLVEISDHIAEDVVNALRGTSLRGQKVTVRKDQPKRSTK
jgi:ATP-dependent RNA helicase DeaD